MKIGITDPGGGLRGVYTVGIYDYCLDHGITFDIAFGVSAGAANLISFMTGEKSRNLCYYTEYPNRKEFMGLYSILTQHSYLNLDFIYNQMNGSQAPHPLDFEAISKNPMELKIIATDARHGMPVYFDRSELGPDHLDALIASASIPVVCPAHPYQGGLYYDGAISDPIPVQKAFDSGCDKVVVLLTMSRDYRRELSSDYGMISVLQRKYPKMAQAAKRRHLVYNRSLALAKKYESEGKAIILAPEGLDHMGLLSKDITSIQKLYKMGYRDGAKLEAFLKA